MLPDQPLLPRALRFDDVIIMPGGSSVPVAQVSLETFFVKDQNLKFPALSKVKTPKDAIALAQQGLLGILDGSLSFGEQIEAARQVKRHQAKLLRQPHTVISDTSVAEAQDMQLRHQFSALPVIDPSNQKVVGIVTRGDIAKGMAKDPASPVSDVMITDLLSVQDGASDQEVQRILQEQMVGQVIVLDQHGHLAGLRTASDFAKYAKYPDATLDAQGRLLVGAVVGVGPDAQDRVSSLLDMGVDVILIEQDFAHAQTVQDMVVYIRRQRCEQRVIIIAGAVQTGDGARALLGSGADMLWIDAAPAMSATGVGVPGFTALQDVVDAASLSHNAVWVQNVANPGVLLKALAAGATGVLTDIMSPEAFKIWSETVTLGVAQIGSKDLKNMYSYARLAILK